MIPFMGWVRGALDKVRGESIDFGITLPGFKFWLCYLLAV